MGCGSSTLDVKSVEVTKGAAIPQLFLAIHDNKIPNAPRLSIVGLDGSCEPVVVEHEGLASAQDLECLFMISKDITKQPDHLYVTMQSNGHAFLFSLVHSAGSYHAVDVVTFSLPAPAIDGVGHINCEGARAYAMPNHSLRIEWASRGGSHEGTPVIPWVCSYPLDISQLMAGTFQVNPYDITVTYMPDEIDGDPLVRQVADLGQGADMAQWGVLCVAAKDDEANETDFMSYIMRRDPHLDSFNRHTLERLTPMFLLKGVKIEAILDATPDISVYATDDEGKGSQLVVLSRSQGLGWPVKVCVPEGQDPRLYGVSGLAIITPCPYQHTKNAASLDEVTGGKYSGQRFLAVHDNKDIGLPRLTVLDLTGQVSIVNVTHAELRQAIDLECLFRLDKKEVRLTETYYIAMTSSGKCFMFNLEDEGDAVTTADVHTFKVPPPAFQDPRTANCEGARAFIEDGTLYMEYGNRGGVTHDGEALTPWVARTILSIPDIFNGTFAPSTSDLHVTTFPSTIDNDPAVRQLADMGQSCDMSRHGMLFVAAKDDEANETDFVSYILQRLSKQDMAAHPNAIELSPDEGILPLFIVKGHKIEAILDLDPELSVYGTDDEGHGAQLVVIQRSSGLQWPVTVRPPPGLSPRALGVSGLAVLEF